MHTYASRHFGFMVNHPKVMPYFVRSVILNTKPEERASNYELEDIKRAELDIDAFSQYVNSNSPSNLEHIFTSAFHDESHLEFFAPELNIEYEFQGCLTILPEGIPADIKFTPIKPRHYRGDYLATVLDYENLYTIALNRQPTSPFNILYKNFDEILDEIKAKLNKLNVELPADFPYWRYIGCFDGVVDDDD